MDTNTITTCGQSGGDGGGNGHRTHCNQGVGNGPEGCDPGELKQGNPSRSNDELGGTPGNPGRKGGNHDAPAISSASTVSRPAAASVHVASRGHSKKK